MAPELLLSLIVFLPAACALLMLIPGLLTEDEHARSFTLFCTIVVFGLTIFLGFSCDWDATKAAAANMQQTFNMAWIPSFNINYYMGIDGISFPLVILTSFISVLAMGASWSIKKHVKGYCVLFLLLETGMLGVFMALDFFLFYVFWEVMLLPMYFLIGVWGGPRREYAAIKFFLYTLVGSVLMLIAILVLYFHSDVRKLAQVSDKYGSGQIQWDDLQMRSSVDSRIEEIVGKSSEEGDSPVWQIVNLDEELFGKGELILVYHGTEFPLDIDYKPLAEDDEDGKTKAVYDESSETLTVLYAEGANAEEVAAAISEESLANVSASMSEPIHSFNLLALAAMGQHTDCFSRTLQHWCFWLLFIGFIIKVPSVPVHTWLPDAHVEAPTPISMILAGVLLKMGGYGIIRICYPICPFGGFDCAYGICLIGVISMVYGAFAAMAQKDFKRLVAYSSVSHMGYVVLGLGVWSAASHTGFNTDYWNMGVKGAMFQMIGHGISSAGMFFMVGVVYDRVHHRNLDEFGGLFGKMPVYTALSIGVFFAGLGLPGLCGFIGEVLVVLSVWKFNVVLAVISAAVVIITAAYILWTLQRVYLGVEYKGPHEEELKPILPREFCVAVPLFVFAILFGIFPHTVPGINCPSILGIMDPTIDRQLDELTDWNRSEYLKGTFSDAEKIAKTKDYESEGGSIAVNAPSGEEPKTEQRFVKYSKSTEP